MLSEENRILTSNIYNNIMDLMDCGYVMIPILSSVLVFRKFSLSRLEAGDRSSLRATEGRGGRGVESILSFDKV